MVLKGPEPVRTLSRYSRVLFLIDLTIEVWWWINNWYYNV